jgi:hypothetical protein
VVHCYAYWTGALDHYRYDQVGSLHLAEYMVEVARAYQASDQRAVWVQEVGTSSEWMPEAYISEYATTLLVRERGRVPKRLGLHLVVLARH